MPSSRTLYGITNTGQKLDLTTHTISSDDLMDDGGAEARLYRVGAHHIAKIFRTKVLDPKTMHGKEVKVREYVTEAQFTPLIHEADATNPHCIVWPLTLLYKDPKYKVFVGYLMPRIHNCRTLYAAAIDPKTTLSEKVSLAYSALGALSMLHRYGLLHGDINLRNFIENRNTGGVLIIDIDSTQYDTSLTKHPANSGMREYASSQLLRQIDATEHKTFFRIERTLEDDLFAIAVTLFELFCDNWHPFLAKNRKQIEENIHSRTFPFEKPDMLPKEAPLQTFNSFPHAIQQAFSNSFNTQTSPTPLNHWRDILRNWTIGAQGATTERIINEPNKPGAMSGNLDSFLEEMLQKERQEKLWEFPIVLSKNYVNLKFPSEE